MLTLLDRIINYITQKRLYEGKHVSFCFQKDVKRILVFRQNRSNYKLHIACYMDTQKRLYEQRKNTINVSHSHPTQCQNKKIKGATALNNNDNILNTVQNAVGSKNSKNGRGKHRQKMLDLGYPGLQVLL